MVTCVDVNPELDQFWLIDYRIYDPEGDGKTKLDWPIKDNRRGDDSGGTRPYQRVDSLEWSSVELRSGKSIKIKDFPRDHKVRCFRVETSPRRTDCDRHQRSSSRLHRGHTTGVRLPLEN